MGNRWQVKVICGVNLGRVCLGAVYLRRVCLNIVYLDVGSGYLVLRLGMSGYV